MLSGFHKSVTFGTVTIYACFTMRVAEQWIRFRCEMNMAAEAAATRTVESLLI